MAFVVNPSAQASLLLHLPSDVIDTAEPSLHGTSPPFLSSPVRWQILSDQAHDTVTTLLLPQRLSITRDATTFPMWYLQVLEIGTTPAPSIVVAAAPEYGTAATRAGHWHSPSCGHAIPSRSPYLRTMTSRLKPGYEAQVEHRLAGRVCGTHERDGIRPGTCGTGRCDIDRTSHGSLHGIAERRAVNPVLSITVGNL